MTITTPTIRLTKADVECIEKLGQACRVFDFTPWEVIEAVEERYSLGKVDFFYEDE